jgi:acyl-CoA synthetase (AMP-forming)/AMP-acid ligase II
MIILGGRNYFPQDIEAIATTVPGIRKGNLIAFGTRGIFGGEEQERVVLAAEVAQPELFDATTVVRAVQSALSITLEVVVLRPGQLPKTSSGKLQRAKTRELYEAGKLQQHPSMREKKWVDALKHLVISQTGFLKSTLRGKQ